MTTEDFLCQCNGWTESFLAYHSKIGFFDAGHHSKCFSHANRLTFRLRYLTGGVQRSSLFHSEAFQSVIIWVMFPSTSFWGKFWRFGALIALPASSELFQMLPFAYWMYKLMSLFLVEQISFLLFSFWFPASSEKLETRRSVPYLFQAKLAPYHLSYLPVEDTGS